jgi:hypothetical protein
MRPDTSGSDAPAHTTPGKINNTVSSRERSSDQECVDTDAEQPSQESVQRQAVWQDVGSFDAVVGNFVVPHLGRPGRSVNEFVHVLRRAAVWR